MLMDRFGLFALRAGRVWRAPLPRELKWQILRTHTALHAPRGRGGDRGPITVPIVGYPWKAYSLESLRFLFNEIFIELHYYFRSGSVCPRIIDCGSNIGISILFFKFLCPGAEVLGFEPDAQAFRLLEENVRRNGFRGVDLHNLALGDSDREIDFYSDPEHPGSQIASSVRHRNPYGTARVRQVRLSGYIDRKVDLLKVDVEGAEEAILRDLVVSGAAERIDQMIIEYHHHIDVDKDAFGDFLSVLRGAGFGYQVGAICDPAMKGRGGPSFQDILVYAYRRDRGGHAGDACSGNGSFTPGDEKGSSSAMRSPAPGG